MVASHGKNMEIDSGGEVQWRFVNDAGTGCLLLAHFESIELE